MHRSNLGYGGNQKTCYSAALRLGADIVLMLHPDYQYDPRLVPAMAMLVASGCLRRGDRQPNHRKWGSSGAECRSTNTSRTGLSAFQNLVLGAKLSEYHTGYRAFSREVLETLPLEANSTILCSTIKCSPRCFIWVFGSVRSPALLATGPNHHRSTFKGPVGTDWGSSGRAFGIGPLGWAWPEPYLRSGWPEVEPGSPQRTARAALNR